MEIEELGIIWSVFRKKKQTECSFVALDNLFSFLGIIQGYYF